jgi:hypothetical protein
MYQSCGVYAYGAHILIYDVLRRLTSGRVYVMFYIRSAPLLAAAGDLGYGSICEPAHPHYDQTFGGLAGGSIRKFFCPLACKTCSPAANTGTERPFYLVHVL